MESIFNSYKAAHTAAAATAVVPCGSSTNNNPNFFDALENSGQIRNVYIF
jgi:hypothetical protein